MIGDGEAETGPLATSWHSNKFLNPIRDGAVLPVLAPQRLQDRESRQSLRAFRTTSWRRCCMAMATSHTSLKATIPSTMHQKMAATLEQCILEIRSIQQHAR